VVVNCAGLTRSILGVYQLPQLGVQNAAALRNGTTGWMLSGHELQTGAIGWQPVARSTAAFERAEQSASEIAERDGVELIEVARLEELRAAADRDPLYIADVRMSHEYLAGHIPGALTCSGGQVAFSDDQIAIRGANLVVVCDGRA
jgi:rhodanese-related sulfurtransferase